MSSSWDGWFSWSLACLRVVWRKSDECVFARKRYFLIYYWLVLHCFLYSHRVKKILYDRDVTKTSKARTFHIFEHAPTITTASYYVKNYFFLLISMSYSAIVQLWIDFFLFLVLLYFYFVLFAPQQCVICVGDKMYWTIVITLIRNVITHRDTKTC